MLLFSLYRYVDSFSAEHRKDISPALSDRYTPRAYAGYGRCTPEGIHGGGVVVIRRGTYTGGEERGDSRCTLQRVHCVCCTRFAWGSQASRVLLSGLASLLVAEHHEGRTRRRLSAVGFTKNACVWIHLSFSHVSYS